MPRTLFCGSILLRPRSIVFHSILDLNLWLIKDNISKETLVIVEHLQAVLYSRNNNIYFIEAAAYSHWNFKKKTAFDKEHSRIVTSSLISVEFTQCSSVHPNSTACTQHLRDINTVIYDQSKVLKRPFSFLGNIRVKYNN